MTSPAPRLRDDKPAFGPPALTRIPITGVLVWGLLSFWAFTAWRVAGVWQAHLQARWARVHPMVDALNLDADGIADLKKRGFAAHTAPATGATVLLALSGLLTLGWFIQGIVLDGLEDARLVVGAVALSSTLFYAGASIFMVWLWRSVQAHEQAEDWLRQARQGTESPGHKPAALEMRWEQAYNRLALFLVVGLPVVFLPTLGAYLLESKSPSGASLFLPAACFLAAIVFHLWGSRLVVNLCNDHFASEQAAAVAAPLPLRRSTPGQERAAVPEPYEGSDPYIFVSYRRSDVERVLPVLATIAGSAHHVWYDKGIPGGAEWDALIERKLQGCALLLFFVSGRAVESKHCRREVKYADQLNKPILSVRLEPAELAHGLEMLLTQYQMVDADHPDLAGEIERALKYLRLL